MYVKNIQIVSDKGKIYDCDFVHGSPNSSEPYFSILVGENGTGKSYLLAQIAECFKINRTERSAHYRYIDYRMTVIDEGVEFLMKKDDSLSNRFVHNEVRLAQISFAVNDKFKFDENVSEGVYYLGARSTSNATFTKSLQRRLLEALAVIYSDKKKSKRFNDLLDKCSIGKRIRATYRIVSLFKNKIDNDKSVKYRTVKKRSLTTLKDALALNSKLGRLHQTGFVSYDVNDEKLLADAFSLYETMEQTKMFELVFNEKTNGVTNVETMKKLLLLEKASFIRLNEMQYEKTDMLSFEWASSGEQQIMYSLANCLAFASNNAIILIDEPETSLHPKWQLDYLTNLQKLLNGYKNIHIIIATHSHLLLNGVNGDNCSVQHFKMNGGIREIQSSKYDETMWSPESVLYNVFGVMTERNRFFEKDVLDAISELDKKTPDISKLEEIQKRLKKLNFSQNDPLVDLLAQIEEVLDD